jgi:hypothetical protein
MTLAGNSEVPMCLWASRLLVPNHDRDGLIDAHAMT